MKGNSFFFTSKHQRLSTFFFSWYFGKIKRITAEKKLLMSGNASGAFLIRDSESHAQDFSLSVRDENSHIKHYRIQPALDESGFFIGNRRRSKVVSEKAVVFHSLVELVNHYSIQPGGLCINLRKACL